MLRRFFSTPTTPTSSSVNPHELAKFAAHSAQWWTKQGEFFFLHAMNPTRLQFVRDVVAQHAPSLHPAWPLHRKRVLDIGCGGGLVAESLARMGACVHGVDAAQANIDVAKLHALHQRFHPHGSLKYECTTAEALHGKGETYDVICALELVEHVDHPDRFLDTLLGMLNPRGFLFVSTLHRTWLSHFLSITVAENWCGWLTKGTHVSSKYVTPDELDRWTHPKATRVAVKGMVPDLTNWQTWSLVSMPTPLLVNYIAAFQRQGGHGGQVGENDNTVHGTERGRGGGEKEEAKSGAVDVRDGGWDARVGERSVKGMRE